MRTLKAILRGAGSLLFFALFGVGGVLIAPVMAVLRSPRLCQPVVRSLWVALVALFRLSGIIGIERGTLSRSLRGCVIAANHPSLIDVVLVSVLVPRTLYVAKPSLLRNPFMSTVVKHTSLPVDERLPDVVAPYLRDGWNVLVFPEGTRSASDGEMHPFRRGVAQLVLRTGAPLVCLGIGVSRRIAGKGQSAWDIGPDRVVYTFNADSPTRHRADGVRAMRPLAVALTEEVHRRISSLIPQCGHTAS